MHEGDREFTWTKIYLCDSSLYHQGRREILEARGPNRETRPIASEASRKFFRTSPLDWFKMHFGTFPAVEML